MQNIEPKFHQPFSQSRRSNVKILNLFFLPFFLLLLSHTQLKNCTGIYKQSAHQMTTIRDVPFLGQSYMKAMISEQWLQTPITVSFQYAILCILICTIRKLRVILGHSTHRTTALLSEMTIFWVRAACEIQLVSYGSKHASQSLSDTPFVRISTSTCKSKTTSHIWMQLPYTVAFCNSQHMDFVASLYTIFRSQQKFYSI